ncbi:MAG: putative bifunctional diguanylate cyclase/phosphodiesterase [Oscillospiraceae bacterium]|jgi:EAL domain-containing protein (putative c-di-GMP-specific phosphodiesterase class I)/PleD family two-component response regulator
MMRSKNIQKARRVLVVDDQEINRDALEVILEDHYEVVCAADGAQALSQIERYDYDISLVMLDLMMPVMNGFEALERMKADERMKAIPVIVLTAEKSAELKALQMGAADFITKPFDVHEIILARVARIIELCEGRQLISSAEHDPLSQLYSRNFFYEYANRLFVYHPELRFDAVTLNIEQFHLINALNGREFGDGVLKRLGEEIRSFLSDTEGIAGRIEADRFEIYCLHREDYTAVLAGFQKMLDAISSSVNIHLRMGVKPWEEGAEPVLMFDHARAACGKARGDYKSALVVYDDDMRGRELLHQRLLNDLRAAVDERQFQVYYQPKYNIQCDPPKLSSAEALIRWSHPELGMISPGEFVPLFEGNGLIHVVDGFVWSEAARQIAEWKERYGFFLPVSVNLSRSDVFDATLIDRLKRLIGDNGLDYTCIKLEVTESAYTENAKQLLDVVSRLRELGFEIEMDDFGSGYSSLNMLSSMPIDVLKMDMKFIRNIETSETDRKLVSLVLDIARYLGVPVVAEGVETQGQLALLREGGCDLVQGYYFSRPVPAQEFEKLIENEMQIERNDHHDA